MTDPVDGFTVERVKGLVVLTISDRYGDAERFTFEPFDAARIGHALVVHAETAMATRI